MEEKSGVDLWIGRSVEDDLTLLLGSRERKDLSDQEDDVG